MPGNDVVNFYQMVPLCDEEIEYKLKNNAESLLELMNDQDLEYIKLDRKSVIES